VDRFSKHVTGLQVHIKLFVFSGCALLAACAIVFTTSIIIRTRSPDASQPINKLAADSYDVRILHQFYRAYEGDKRRGGVFEQLVLNLQGQRGVNVADLVQLLGPPTDRDEGYLEYSFYNDSGGLSYFFVVCDAGDHVTAMSVDSTPARTGPTTQFSP
jgi:hypothetical protein